eukprot:SAG11_NODE_917_length_6553_cov_24.570654_3_plen_265_part_00
MVEPRRVTSNQTAQPWTASYPWASIANGSAAGPATDSAQGERRDQRQRTQTSCKPGRALSGQNSASVSGWGRTVEPEHDEVEVLSRGRLEVDGGVRNKRRLIQRRRRRRAVGRAVSTGRVGRVGRGAILAQDAGGPQDVVDRGLEVRAGGERREGGDVHAVERLAGVPEVGPGLLLGVELRIVERRGVERGARGEEEAAGLEPFLTRWGRGGGGTAPDLSRGAPLQKRAAEERREGEGRGRRLGRPAVSGPRSSSSKRWPSSSI